MSVALTIRTKGIKPVESTITSIQRATLPALHALTEPCVPLILSVAETAQISRTPATPFVLNTRRAIRIHFCTLARLLLLLLLLHCRHYGLPADVWIMRSVSASVASTSLTSMVSFRYWLKYSHRREFHTLLGFIWYMAQKVCFEHRKSLSTHCLAVVHHGHRGRLFSKKTMCNTCKRLFIEAAGLHRHAKVKKKCIAATCAQKMVSCNTYDSLTAQILWAEARKNFSQSQNKSPFIILLLSYFVILINSLFKQNRKRKLNIK